MKRFTFLFLIAVLAVSLTGCIKLSKKSEVTGTSGGVFLSIDKGENFTSNSMLMTAGALAESIGGVNVLTMEFDPGDSEAIYLGTRSSGMYYSYNSGKGWQKANRLPDKGSVRSIGLDAKDKCNVYVAMGRYLYKSFECNRSWTEVFASDKGYAISAVAVDWYDNRIVYFGDSNGNFYKSEDYGRSWKLLKDFESVVRKIYVDPFDSRVVYVGLEEKGLYKTTNKGGEWENLTANMDGFSGVKKYYASALAKNQKNTLFYASKAGLLKTEDGGGTWTQLSTLDEKDIIFAIGVDPQDINNLLFSTKTAYFKSIDGGENWITKKMPTTRTASDILIHPTNSSVVYMAVKSFIE